MSIKILARGILDTIQDQGRTGNQHLGINVNGAMDSYSAQLANALLGKDLASPVIEMHFPASEINFQASTIICLTGGNFSPRLNNEHIPMNRPIRVPENSILKFVRITAGARCYLATLHDLEIKPWMKSFSTNLKAESGGYEGRKLRRDDVIKFVPLKQSLPLKSEFADILSWNAGSMHLRTDNRLEIMKGNEWNWLNEQSKKEFMNGKFLITHQADRMGYRLMGKALGIKEESQLVSSGVKCGTIQLLPSGQLIVLMADAHTTGGYPRIAHIISTDIPALAQLTPRSYIQFKNSDHESAETKIIQQQEYLVAVQRSSNMKMQNYLNVFG